MAASIRPFASYGVEGITIFSPGVANLASIDCEWYRAPCTWPPMGALITSGAPQPPSVLGPLPQTTGLQPSADSSAQSGTAAPSPRLLPAAPEVAGVDRFFATPDAAQDGWHHPNAALVRSLEANWAVARELVTWMT